MSSSPSPLPLATRESAWNALWRRLLAEPEPKPARDDDEAEAAPDESERAA